MYNAYEKDIAVVNLYFGDSTAFGKKEKNSLWSTVTSFLSLRVREISKNDLAGLHLQLGRDLRTLPWHQLCLCHRVRLLVLNQTL